MPSSFLESPDAVDLLASDGSDPLVTVAAAIAELGRRAVVRHVDIVDGALREAVVDAETKVGLVNVVVANAAISQRAPFLEISEQDWNRMVAVNLTGTWNTPRAVLPAMRERACGVIVLIGSIASSRGMAELAHYSASKHGVAGLAKSVAPEFGVDGIRVNAVLPTRGLSPMLAFPALRRRLRLDLPDPRLEDARDLHARRHVLPVPWVESAAVTAAVSWLASDEARSVTGAELSVDAGALL